MLCSESKIVLCGGAGLVGQNLIYILDKQGYKNLIVIDKHQENIKILKSSLEFAWSSTSHSRRKPG